MTTLATVYQTENAYEIGVDEAGRGPLFGRLYVAAVIVPPGGFQNPGIKDSKKIKSKKKMEELSAYIQQRHLTINKAVSRQTGEFIYVPVRECSTPIKLVLDYHELDTGIPEQ
jgi:ribonuclease HII